MRIVGLTFFCVAAASLGWAQSWEFGGAAGAGFLSNVSASSPTYGSATTGFRTGPSFSAFVSQHSRSHISGELRYGFMLNSLHIQSSGSEATFSGQAHVVHYDLVWHTTAHAKHEYFVAAGGGFKLFRGTGAEQAYQPLSQFGYFTKTHVIKPMASIGGGVRYAIGDNLYLRAEMRDYITAFPKELIAPAPGVKFGSLLHDIVPMVGISFLF